MGQTRSTYLTRPTMALKIYTLSPTIPKVRVEYPSLAPAQRPRDEGDRVVYMGLVASPSRQHYWAVYHVDLTDVSLRRWEWAGRTHFERHKLDNLPPSLTTHDRQIIGRVLQSSVMLSESGYKGNRAEVGSEPPATWHLGLLPAAPTKLTTEPGLAQGSLCDDDDAIYVAGENDSLEMIATWLRDASNYVSPPGSKLPDADKLLEWNRGREDLRPHYRG